MHLHRHFILTIGENECTEWRLGKNMSTGHHNSFLKEEVFRKGGTATMLSLGRNPWGSVPSHPNNYILR